MSARLSIVLSTLTVCHHRISSIRPRSWQVALLLAGLVAVASPCLAERTYHTKDDAIDMVLPEGWRVDDSGIRGTLAIFYPDQDSYRSGVSVINLLSRRILSLAIETATLEESVGQFRRRIRAENLQILEEKRRRVGGEAAYEFRLIHIQSTKLEIVLITVFKKNEYMFVLSAHDQQELDARRPVFDWIISRLRWRRPERVYRSDDDALTLDVPLQWTVMEDYEGKDRFVLIGPADRGIANVVAVSRWERNGRSLREFVRQYIRDSAKDTVTEIGELKNKGPRYLIFTKIGDPPVTQRQRYLYDHNAYVLEFRLNHFDIASGDAPSRGIFSPPVFDRRDIRVMQTFVVVGNYIYIFNFNSFKESYQLYLPVVEDILQSVRWR
jgi:hypothetical protein